MWVEILGILSGCIFYGAMATKNLVLIKSLLLIGTLGFLAYGIILSLPTIIIVDAIGTVVGVYGLKKAIKHRGQDGSE